MIKQQSVISLLAGWTITSVNNNYYTNSIHAKYIELISSYFSKVYLICPLKKNEDTNNSKLSLLSSQKIKVIPLPAYKSLVKSLKHSKYYKNAIQAVKDETDLFYCRVPDPFCWMPAQITDKPVIMHFVGDTIDATKFNINFSWLKKRILIAGYSFEYRRIIKSAKKSVVYTNGNHLAEKLKTKGVKATPVISSTITNNDLAPNPLKSLSNKPFNIIYVGYLRYAKGIDTMTNVIKELERRGFKYHFHIVGSGEMYDALNKLICELNAEDHIHLYGHIDDRKKLFSHLRNSDLFFFPSLSEGSPRVVIEAMSQGCPVLSTPVGSLPTCFKENEEILFFPFNDAEKATSLIVEKSQDLDNLTAIRNKAYKRVAKEFTMEQFIRTITTY